MKKRIIISTFLIMICLLTGNCYARAGGGSGSGSSGGGGSSSSSSSPSYYHDHDHYYYGRRSYNPVSSIVSVGLFIGTIYGVYAFQRRYKANKLHQRAKKQLAILDDQDDFWNEKRIKEEVKKSYYLIQEAWGHQDLKTLKKYLTENLYDAWEAKINWNEFQGKRNELSHIHLLKQNVVNLYDSENDNEDYFWVYIEGKMNDVTVDQQNQVIESYDGVFVEYWKFKRCGKQILLDEVRQQDEYEN